MKPAENDAGLDTDFTVIGLYFLANLAYLGTLPFDQIQNAPLDRVATSTLEVVLPGRGALIMAVGIIILEMLLIYRNATTWPGFVIVALGVPVYFVWGRRGTGRE